MSFCNNFVLNIGRPDRPNCSLFSCWAETIKQGTMRTSIFIHFNHWLCVDEEALNIRCGVLSLRQ